MNYQNLNSAIYNVMNEETIFLSEALAASAHKSMATKAANASKDATGLTQAERISKNSMPKDRIVIPLERTSTPHQAVTKHLSSHGYSIAGDYSEGLASHSSTPDRKIKIGKILASTEAPQGVKTAFEKDPARQGIKSENKASVVISRRPSDVAAGSTHQQWQSCQTLGGTALKDGVENKQESGSHKELMPGIISSGAHVAYLVHHPDDVDKHYKPIARVSLNHFVSTNGKHSILRPSQNYGEEWEGFHNTVNKWAEANHPATHPEYRRHDGSYPEGQQLIHNYSPDHNDYWKKHGVYSQTAQTNHPEPEVLDHMSHHILDNLKTNTSFSSLGHLLSNPKMSQDTHDSIADKASKIKVDHKTYESHQLTNLKNSVTTGVKGSHNVQTMLDNNPSDFNIGVAATKNTSTTSTQLHHILDTHSLKEISPGVRTKIEHKAYGAGQVPNNIMNGVIRNPNSDDSHYTKILQMDELNHTDPTKKYEAGLDHAGKLEEMSAKYKTEDVGSKLINVVNDEKLFHHTRVVSNVAEKHPHLLSRLSDDAIADSYNRHPRSPNLELETIRRGGNGHFPSLNTLASKSKDRELVNSLTKHENPIISSNAKNNLKSIDMYK